MLRPCSCHNARTLDDHRHTNISDDDDQLLPLAARLAQKGKTSSQTDNGVLKEKPSQVANMQSAKSDRRKGGGKRALPQDAAVATRAQHPAQRRKFVHAKQKLHLSHQVVATCAAILAHQQSGQLRGRYSSFRDDNPMHTGHGVSRGGKDSGGVDWLAVQWYSETAQDRSRRTAKQKRAKCWAKYTVCEAAKRAIESKDFAFFNQGQCGGCAFAALSYLCQLGDVKLRASWRRKVCINASLSILFL